MVSIKYEIRYLTKENEENVKIMTAEQGANLLHFLREHHVALEASCNGKGVCGKCRVRIRKGNAPVTEADRRFFTEQELAAGIRLACEVRVQDNLTVCAINERMDIQAIGLLQGAGSVEACRNAEAACGFGVQSGEKRFQLAVDLGSTTLAAVLLDAQGTVLAQASAVNSQRAYGTDVLSRIQASKEGQGRQLQECICRDLEQLFDTLVSGQKEAVFISEIAIAGNTTMFHLLRGYSCETLGQAPFEPVSVEMECLDYRELFSDVPGCSDSKVYLLPGISAFIGADITAGLYSSGFWQTGADAPAFFIDLGTNGELAYGSREGFFTASTAAGPAFEGGRLSCGVPGIPGAICGVSFLYHRVRIQTIGQKKPCGICGTGAMEATAALLREGLLDTDGLLAPQLFEAGLLLAHREDGSGICLTQADIREIQLAKAAIRAGLWVLQHRYEEAYGSAADQSRPGRIFLAGGFGYYLAADTAAAIGLFAPEWKDRIVLCGNTSLKGAAAFLTEPSCAKELERIRTKNHSVRLESDAAFQERFVQEMRFPDQG